MCDTIATHFHDGMGVERDSVCRGQSCPATTVPISGRGKLTNGPTKVGLYIANMTAQVLLND